MASMDLDFDGAGRLWVEGGRVRFEGDASKAAQLFIDGHCRPLIEAEIENRTKGTPEQSLSGSERAVKRPSEKRGKKRGASDD